VAAVTIVLEASELYRFYHAGDAETLALRGVSLVVEEGELVALIGPSGSGKSTLLNCLAGLDEPDGGTVRVAGERLSRRSEQERARLRAHFIGVLFQSANLLAHLDVRQNVLLAQRLAGSADGERADELLRSVGIAGRARGVPTQLSGGELARAGLAVALANDPPVLLADEPTGELDSRSADQIVDLLRARARSGTAVVAVTHNESIAEAADRVVELRDGRLAA
jgi:putative ABC transport system ATP-binding protein